MPFSTPADIQRAAQRLRGLGFRVRCLWQIEGPRRDRADDVSSEREGPRWALQCWQVGGDVRLVQIFRDGDHDAGWEVYRPAPGPTVADAVVWFTPTGGPELTGPDRSAPKVFSPDRGSQ